MRRNVLSVVGTLAVLSVLAVVLWAVRAKPREVPVAEPAAEPATTQPVEPVKAAAVVAQAPRPAPAARAAAPKASAPIHVRSDALPKYPSEVGRLSSVYDYWASQPADLQLTRSEQDRIERLFEETEVHPQSMHLACSSKICRCQLAFGDMKAALAMSKIKPKTDRRIYAAADPENGEMRLSLYWTLTDEAKDEAPEPVPQPGDVPFEATPDGAYDPEPARPVEG